MDKVQEHTFVLILAGGGGTRLWPMSRDASPKQFLKLFGGKSLFELTLERARRIAPLSNILISTSVRHLPEIKKHVPGIPEENLIGEPMRRDTALAMGLGAAVIYNRDPEAVIVNLASDHMIKSLALFVRDIGKAVKLADESHNLVTIGIKPRFPHTGMGHIKVSKGIGVKFVEKPDLATAKKLTSSGDYYWNANLYVWRAKTLLDLLKTHAPKTYVNLPKIITGIGTDRERSAIQLAFQMAPTISIDFAVSEKLSKFGFIEAGFDWTDVGDWSELYSNLDKDALGNVIYSGKNKGKFIGVNTKNSLFMLDKKLVAAIGVENLMIVDTPDALLVCRADDDQAVKQVVQILKEKELKQYL
jgi:mannose-1-phosphate guanylyltransferase